MRTRMAADYAGLIEPLVGHFWNEPNERFSKPTDLRFDAHGSKSVDVQKSSFFDHESSNGGGVTKLVPCCTSIKTRGAARQWLVQNGFIGGNNNKVSIGREVMQIMKSPNALESAPTSPAKPAPKPRNAPMSNWTHISRRWRAGSPAFDGAILTKVLRRLRAFSIVVDDPGRAGARHGIH